MIRQAEGQLLPLHHPSLHRHQLPLDGAPQLPPLPAGQGSGCPWARCRSLPPPRGPARRAAPPARRAEAPSGTQWAAASSAPLPGETTSSQGDPPATVRRSRSPQLPAHRLPDALALLGYPEILHRSRPFPPPQSGAFPLFLFPPHPFFPFFVCLPASFFCPRPLRPFLDFLRPNGVLL